MSLLSTDMSKAFDSLYPPLLLSKLKAYGFENSTVRLLESYLCDRNYRVKIGDLLSSSRTVNRGCLQGCSLGPLPWNIFQNDLSYCVTTNLSMYADDHQIYHIGRDQSSVMLRLKESEYQATEWYNSNLLAENLKKYQIINIGYSQNDDNITQVSRLNNHDINTTSSLKLLGVTIDSELKFFRAH